MREKERERESERGRRREREGERERERGRGGGGRRSPNKTCCPSLSVTPSYSLSDSHLTVKSSGPDLSVSSTFCRGVLLKL